MATGVSTAERPSPSSTSVMRKQQAALLKSNELAVFTMLQEKTAEIRKKMTLKYKVEF